MLQIQNLTIVHRRDSRILLRDFSFVLRPGDRAVLIGEEGDGKSTLLRTICDPALTADYVETTGAVVRSGLRLGYLPQELTPGEKDLSVLDFCAKDPDFYTLAPADIAHVTARIGLPAGFLYSDQPVGTLSGGEKVKIQLTCLLLRRPDVLLLDEPSNDLDLETLGWLENFLLTCGLPTLYVSHDETLIERTANVVIHLEQLRHKTMPQYTVARMPYRRYVSERMARQAHQTQVARKEHSDWERQQEKLRQIESKVAHQLTTISRGDPHGGRLLKKKMKAVQSMARRFDREQEGRTPLPETEDAILFRFPENITVPHGKTILDFRLETLSAGGRILARHIRLPIEGPRKIVIVGPNGTGKTTLLRQIAAELLMRTDIRAGYMPQDYADGLTGGVTPVQFLAHSAERTEITRVRTLLGSLKYTAEEMAHPAAALSGGQKAKLFLMKMMGDGCNVLILDEPTRNLSPLSGPVIRDVLRSFGGAIVSVSHDRRYMTEVCDTVYRLTPDGLVAEPQGATDT